VIREEWNTQRIRDSILKVLALWGEKILAAVAEVWGIHSLVSSPSLPIQDYCTLVHRSLLGLLSNGKVSKGNR
jgi:hypothetical protein